MDILSDWRFWVIIAAILFILALIGFLTDGLRKSKKEKEEVKQPEKPEEGNVQPVAPAEPVTPVETAVNNDWTSMPEVKPLEEVKVDTLETPVENVAESTVETPLFEMPTEVKSEEAPVVEQSLETPVETVPTLDETTTFVETPSVGTPEVKPEEVAGVQPTVQASTEQSTENPVETDIWNS